MGQANHEMKQVLKIKNKHNLAYNFINPKISKQFKIISLIFLFKSTNLDTSAQ